METMPIHIRNVC